MTKRFRPWDPKQKWPLPPEITDFIPEGHASHFVRNLVGKRQLTAPGGLFQQVLVLVLGRQAGLRGLVKVKAEWQLVCTAHNLPDLVSADS